MSDDDTTTTPVEAPVVDKDTPKPDALPNDPRERGTAAGDDTPKPKRRGRPIRKPRTSSTTPRPRASSKKVDIRAGVRDMYANMAVAISFVPSGPAAIGVEGHAITSTQAVGLVIAEQAEACANAWGDAADANPRIREALERVLTVSIMGAVIAAHVPIAIGVAVAVGAVPPQLASMYAAMATPQEPSGAKA